MVYEFRRQLFARRPLNKMTTLKDLKETIDRPLENFLDNADLAKDEEADRGAVELSCNCQKCGDEVICLHDSNESHTNTLCGTCAS